MASRPSNLEACPPLPVTVVFKEDTASAVAESPVNSSFIVELRTSTEDAELDPSGKTSATTADRAVDALPVSGSCAATASRTLSTASPV